MSSTVSRTRFIVSLYLASSPYFLFPIAQRLQKSIGTTIRMKPAAEIEIDKALVLRLLKEQHPHLSNLPLTYIDSGWDNVIYRLGELCLRFPRRAVAAKLIENEQNWLPHLKQSLTLPAPIPKRIGYPTAYYPWRWSILPWLNGVSAEIELTHSSQAKVLGFFLKSLHCATSPDNAPINPVRGIPLKEKAAAIKQRIDSVASKAKISPQIAEIWHYVIEIPIDTDPCWLHGDLHPGNVLIRDGKIAGIIDWGDLTSGDVATDLAAIWMLFEDKLAREKAIAKYGKISQATWYRSIGWAIHFATILLDVGLDSNPKQAAVGKRTLRCVMEDWQANHKA